MTKTNYEKQLEEQGVIQYLNSDKKKLRDMLISLYAAYTHFLKDKKADGAIIENLVWELLRLDPTIQNFFLDNDYSKELFIPPNEGLVSKKLVKIVIAIVETEYPGDFV